MPSSYSLALGGGAARGFAHIGVYRYLQEKNITIDEIAGTSMGALVASFIAIGKSEEEMTQFAKGVSYRKLIDTDLTLGLIRGEKIIALLKGVFGDMDIQETKIPLRIAATNLDSGTVKIFTRGKIVDALRASFSLPGIFCPQVIDGTHYVDGGIIMNLPVQALTGENIIAISALDTTFDEIVKTKRILWFDIRSGFFRNNFEILQRSVNLLMKTNEDISMLTVGKNIQLVRPHFSDLNALDFKKVDEFVALGYEAAKKLEL